MDQENSNIASIPSGDTSPPTDVSVYFRGIRQRNWKRKIWGWGLTILSTVNALDFESPFPIPLMGMAAISASILLWIAGGVLLYLVYRPQVDDTLELAPHSNGIMTVLLVKNTLGVTLATAERTIRRLWRKGYLKLIRKTEDEAGIQISKRFDDDMLNFLKDLRSGQQELAHCVFRVPLAAAEGVQKLPVGESPVSSEVVPEEELQYLLKRLGAPPAQQL